MKYTKGDIFLDKDTHKLYIFDGKEWLEIVPTAELKKLICGNNSFTK